jgi:hypothetical protein
LRCLGIFFLSGVKFGGAECSQTGPYSLLSRNVHIDSRISMSGCGENIYAFDIARKDMSHSVTGVQPM